MVNRISLTPASNSSRQPSFPRNVPSRSTFHSGKFGEKVISLEINCDFSHLQVKLGQEIAVLREQLVRILHTQIKVEVFYKEFQAASVNGESKC
jgi:hypothetical protein